MSQQLLVLNDTTADYVKFDVLIPDGYNKFKLNYMNGTIINQNYLNINDKIRFTFNNKPIKYDNVNLRPLMIFNDSERFDNRTYEYVKFDVFNYYELVFLPVYSFYYEGNYKYVINPCLTTQILKEPVKYLPPIQVSDFKGAPTFTANQIFAGFTGYYVLGLKEVVDNKIPDINIVIGESISNSKTKPQDLATYSINAEAINDIPSQSIQTNAYNYGNTWNYPVNNLLMNHHETIIINSNNNNDKVNYKLVFANKSTKTTTNEYISSFSIISSSSPDDNYIFYRVSPISPYIRELDKNIVLPTNNEQLQGLILDIVKYNTETNTYSIIQTTPESTVNITGSELLSNEYKYITDDLTIHDFNSTNTKYINTTFNYSTNSFNIQLGARYHDEPTAEFVYSGLLSDFHLTINNVDNSTPTLIKFDNSVIYVMKGIVYDEQQQIIEEVLFDVVFKIQSENNQDYENTDLYTFILMGELFIDNYEHTASIRTKLNTGFIDEHTYNILNTNYSSIPLQLTDKNNANLNPEDIYVSSEHDEEADKYGLIFKLNRLKTNVVHNLTYNNNNVNITNFKFKWFYDNIGVNHVNDKDLLCFIPMKTHRPLTAFKGRLASNWKPGFFEIKDLNGCSLNDKQFIDANVEVFLAGGWDTLIVEQPTEDDGKFKTFNGSLTFDRSNSRITRIFSNDATGSCLGYLNDILAAKLARYFYVANVDIFNAFFPTDNSLSITSNPKALYGLYTQYDNLFTGNHTMLFSSCSDLIKLIGSENIVNNCLSSLHVEQQAINTDIWNYQQLINDNNKELLLSDIPKQFTYKFFHFYNSGLNEYPYNGLSINDESNGATTCGGVNVLMLNNSKLVSPSANERHTNTLTNKPYFVMDGTTSYDNYDELKVSLLKNSYYYNTNSNLNDYGYIETLPAYRLYKNANFEQSDLSISTGGIKTLHPIYLQSTPRILINNILYLVDYFIDYMIKSVGGFTKDNFDYVGLLTTNTSHLLLNVDYPLIRYSKINRYVKTGTLRYISVSFDSLLFLNYLTGNSLNEYSSNEEIKRTIPSGSYNEEIISDMITENNNSMNAQLFSSKYFNFKNNVSWLSMVSMKTQYIEQIIMNDDNFKLYYSINALNDVNTNVKIQNLVNSFINNIGSYNNLKNIKILIVKLGEYLQYPKILFGVCNNFNNSVNVSIDNLNMYKYKTPLTNEYEYNINEQTGLQTTNNITKLNYDLDYQKINVYLYGVMFKYHQMNLGYQWLNNEISNEYLITRALGNRHFELTICDEYGRLIPNIDTSQGYRNRLYLEIELIN